MAKTNGRQRVAPRKSAETPRGDILTAIRREIAELAQFPEGMSFDKEIKYAARLFAIGDAAIALARASAADPQEAAYQAFRLMRGDVGPKPNAVLTEDERAALETCLDIAFHFDKVDYDNGRTGGIGTLHPRSWLASLHVTRLRRVVPAAPGGDERVEHAVELIARWSEAWRGERWSGWRKWPRTILEASLLRWNMELEALDERFRVWRTRPSELVELLMTYDPNPPRGRPKLGEPRRQNATAILGHLCQGNGAFDIPPRMAPDLATKRFLVALGRRKELQRKE